MYHFEVEIISLIKEKYMKKLYILMTFALLAIMSCKKDFIDLNPISSVSVNTMYKTDVDFYNAFPPIYNDLQGIYNTFFRFGDIRADDSEQEIASDLESWNVDLFVTSSSSAWINSQWKAYYQAINRANIILEQIADKNVENKDQYIAEAKFLRAFLYFDLVRIWGDVPMVTKPLTIEESYKTPRESVANIYSQIIIPDLIAAEAVLPSVQPAKDLGKPTKGAASAILGRVYLTMSDFQKAELKLQEVTTMGYALLPNYNDLWDPTKDKHSSEYIFDIEYAAGMGEGNSFTNLMMPNYAPMFAFYNMVSTEGGEANSPTQTLRDLFDNKDSRKLVTVGVLHGFYDADSVFHRISSNTSQSYTMKYMCPFTSADDAEANWKVIRYGDVILMYAEALNENGKTDQAITYLNQIRIRAGLLGYPAGMTQSDTRNAISLERRFELSFEGVRWFDLVRTGQAFNVMKNNGMLEFMNIWPLPLTQVQLINNNTIFPQNPGY